MDYCLVYVSASAELVSPAVLEELNQQSQLRNQGLHVTGLLLYLGGSTLHILEGSKEVVLQEFELISRDCRHQYVTVLFRGPISGRLFTDWHINYKASGITRLAQLMALKQRQELRSAPESGVVLSLLWTFYENNHRN